MISEVFGEQGLIFLVIALPSFVVAVWALADAAMRPGPAFNAAGQTKPLWIILPLVGIILFMIIGGILGLIYLISIRPKVRQAQLEF